jgi:hypothetical protein
MKIKVSKKQLKKLFKMYEFYVNNHCKTKNKKNANN